VNNEDARFLVETRHGQTPLIMPRWHVASLQPDHWHSFSGAAHPEKTSARGAGNSRTIRNCPDSFMPWFPFGADY